MPPAVTQALDAYVQNGGRLLLTGSTVATQHGALAGVAPVEGGLIGGYVPSGNGCTTAGAVWQKVTLTDATELAPLLNQQESELNKAGTAAATLRSAGSGRVAAIHGNIFRSYYLGHYPGMREFIGEASRPWMRRAWPACRAPGGSRCPPERRTTGRWSSS